MRKKIMIAVGILAGIVLVFVGIVAAQPSEFRITRSTKISAPPDIVFAQVDDFHNWEGWSPWAKLDPAAKNTFEGPAAGKGAIFKWSGNDKVGEGQMTLTDSQPNDKILIKLEFKRPFEDTSTTEFTFKPEGDQTTVTWSMFGQQNFMEKAICMFMNMDKMLGADFEKGLAQLKKVSEEEAAAKK
ncbi:MAG: hypothetical protein JWN70_3522 [Planctomycetaceae bacterium]|nr:hypothetical protein [Planctomycetaceae bacterium]